MLTICACNSSLAARKVNFENLQEVVNIGEIYNINVLFSSENNSKGESYVVAHYGGYYMGRCNDHGPCGCASVANVSLFKFSDKGKLNLIDSKLVDNTCSASEDNQYSVKYNKEYIFLFSEKSGTMNLVYVLNKSNLDFGFIAATQDEKNSTNTSTELIDSYVSDAPYTDNKPGFDCKRASNYIENQICSSVELSELDSKMSRLYKNLINHGIVDVSMLKKSQIQFNATRSKLCADIVCIKDLTSKRITELRQLKKTEAPAI